MPIDGALGRGRRVARAWLHLVIGALSLAIPSRTWCQPSLELVPRGPYTLEYSLDELHMAGMPSKLRGAYSVTESDGSILIRCTLGKVQTTLEYEDGKSLLLFDRGGGGQQGTPTSDIYLDGQQIDSIQPTLLLPFQYESFRVYYGIEFYRDHLDQYFSGAKNLPAKFVGAMRDVGDSNLSVVVGEQGGVPQARPAKWSQQGEEAGETANLLVGTQGAPMLEYRYSNFANLAGVPVPRTVIITQFGGWSETSRGTPQTRYELKLVDSAEGPGVAKPNIGSVLKKGDWVSYTGADGRSAGVVFDSSEGSFTHQLALQLKLRGKGGQSLTLPKSRGGPSLVLPLALTAVFGFISLAFLVRHLKGKG